MANERRPRRVVGVRGMLVATAVVAIALVGHGAFAGGSPSPAGAPGYSFSNIRAEYSVDIPSGQRVLNRASVSFDYRWATDRYPGARRCTVSVFSAERNMVGEETWPAFTGLSPGRLETTVRVTGAPSSASIACGEQRSDDSSGYYDFVDSSVSRRAATTAHLEFSVRWVGALPPAAQECTAAVLGPSGEVLTTYDFNLVLMNGRLDDAGTDVVTASPFEEEPTSATFDCRNVTS